MGGWFPIVPPAAQTKAASLPMAFGWGIVPELAYQKGINSINITTHIGTGIIIRVSGTKDRSIDIRVTHHCFLVL